MVSGEMGGVSLVLGGVENQGKVGSPLETWEPQTHLLGTEALDIWMVAKTAEAEEAARAEAAAEAMEEGDEMHQA
eukprot:126210-Pleurochrysis_carterae.AAC.2